MTRRRQTFEVSALRTWANAVLADSALSAEQKRGVAIALDHVLHQTGNYKGFGYVYKDEQRPCLPGKIGNEAVNPEWTAEHEARRCYYA